MDIVIGSGPSGIACAHSLLEHNRKVLILDFGYDLETSTQKIIDKMSRIPYEQWETGDIKHIKKDYVNVKSELSNKLVYGSDYPYQGIDDYYELIQKDVEVLPSLAVGGFSNVWGSAILPMNQRDMTNWPISIEELDKHYSKVMSIIPTSTASDELQHLFQIYNNSDHSLLSSEQTQSLIKRMRNNSERLNREGYLYGKSRLSVNTGVNKSGFGCCYCGMCLYGCPYQLIFSSKDLLRSMMEQFPKLEYRPNVFVDRIDEKNGEANVTYFDRFTHEAKRIVADRVFLGAGALSTTAILLKSLESYHDEIKMRDSQYFLFPFVSFSSSGNVVEEKLHTLAQLFLEVFDKNISQNTVHLQVYTYNDFFLNKLKKITGIFFPYFKDIVLGRLHLFQGFLHSDYSHTISISLERNQKYQKDILVLDKIDNPVTLPTTNKLLAKLRNDSFLLGGIPIKLLMEMTKPGRSFHTGATFPMTLTPHKFQSDVLGRPYGFEKVFIVDSSNFPSIPATTITLTAMANAHRIGSLSTQ